MSELNKTKKLLLSLLFDAIGMLSFALPGIGEFSDVIWAPISAWLITRMYKGKVGQAAGAFSLLEEIMPGMDVIPTFTIMWFYTYVLKGAKKENVVNVEAS